MQRCPYQALPKSRSSEHGGIGRDIACIAMKPQPITLPTIIDQSSALLGRIAHDVVTWDAFDFADPPCIALVDR
jgi:hypothetical protein